MDDLIQRQKQFAQELLQKWRQFDPSIILAGGAPRNWAEGKPAKDFDFWTYCPLDVLRTISQYGSGFILNTLDEKSDYRNDRDIDTIWNKETELGKIQLISISVPPEYMATNFPISCSQVWFDGDTVHSTELYKQAETDKVLVRDERGYLLELDSKYYQKIISYYPERTVFLSVNDYNDWRQAHGKDRI